MIKLDGQALATKWQDSLTIPKTSQKLGIIQVGEDPASSAYIKRKTRVFAEKGLETKLISMSEKATTWEIMSECHKMVGDRELFGFMVQLPLPSEVETDVVLSAIEPGKDVDGLNPWNLGSLWDHQHYGHTSLWSYLNLQETKKLHFTIPATVVGIMYLLQAEKIAVKDKRVVIINKSPLVGSPLAAICLGLGAQVTIIDGRDSNKEKALSEGQIIMTAVGQPKWLTSNLASKAEVIIDIGIAKTSEGIVGDVDAESFSSTDVKITPVPGGVGPLTVAGLIYNAARLLV